MKKLVGLEPGLKLFSSSINSSASLDVDGISFLGLSDFKFSDSDFNSIEFYF
jgi:hypothetical protein